MNNDDREKNEKSGGASPNQHAPSGDRLAPVITLHHHDQHTDDTPEVVEGEIVDPTCGPQVEDPAPGTPGAEVVSRRDIYRSDLHAAGRGALAVATHPVTVGGTKALVRNTWFVFSGAGVLVQRWRDTHGTTRYERQMRAAEAAGDQDRLLEWEARDVAEKARRHGRVMDWVNAPLAWARAAGVGALITLGMLVGLGAVLAIAAKDISLVIAPITTVIHTIAWVVTFVTVYATVLTTLALTGAALGLWALGRARTEVPAWVATPSPPDQARGELVTADGIVTALTHLPIPKLRDAIKKNSWTPRFALIPTREGHGAFRGYRTIFDLPMGVTPKMITDQAEVLARNLHRITVEVWASDHGKEPGGTAGYVNLYVADSGVMDKPTPAYPLLHDGQTDVFTGVPMGITQRGEPVTMPVVGSNSVFGGQPGQGKSNAVRVAVAGIALDPLAEIRVHVFALNGDFDAYTPRLSRYDKGATTDHVTAAAEHLHHLYDEVGRREGRLAQLGAKKLTRPIAAKHPDLRPLVVAFSECHELFSHSEHGSLAAELAIAVVKRGRKTGITLIFDTQSARANAIPGQLVENVGFNGCFAVKTWRSNDGFLGDGSFAAGIRATELRFNTDRGTMITTGATDELFDLVRTYFIDVDDDTGWDQATDIITRATTNLAAHTPSATSHDTEDEIPARSLLADLITVCGGERVPAADLPARLRDLAPDWAPYQRLTGTKLRARLAAEHGIHVPSTKNKYPVDPDTLRDTHAREEQTARDEDDTAGDDDTGHG
ncbi:hypothetical protein [Pseudonocardia sp. ICBG601]|uniref:hypothetical protein n=1 Tax=Pseudonocardia sp. ICBG601 TaxID=2846759 RepID=UPI001CF611A8|nr:hypothetical protein [Pseudonocardia sp. ICBG601]